MVLQEKSAKKYGNALHHFISHYVTLHHFISQIIKIITNHLSVLNL